NKPQLTTLFWKFTGQSHDRIGVAPRKCFDPPSRRWLKESMTSIEVLCRHFSRMGARLRIQEPLTRQREKVRIDVSRDNHGEFFDIRCQDGDLPEILDVQRPTRHLVLMVRDGNNKNKFLLGHDERHWFAAAVPGDYVRDVRTAMESLRPAEVEGRRA